MSEEGFEGLKLVWHDDVAVILLSRPDALNALTPALGQSFRAALSDLHGRARALVITGEGRAFCAGADLSGSGGAGRVLLRHEAGSGLEAIYHPLVRELAGFTVPVVAAVNGPAVGLGASLALCADLIVCAQSAYFLFAFQKVGLVPDGGATFLLTRAIGRVRASELLLLGERLKAEDALRWGLVNQVVNDGDVLDRAVALATKLADGPAASIRYTRALLWQALEAGWTAQLQAEREAQREASLNPDYREGVAAFREKRPPDFRGTRTNRDDVPDN